MMVQSQGCNINNIKNKWSEYKSKIMKRDRGN